MSIACGLNGFGRFGLHLLKYWLDRSAESAFSIRYINDETLTIREALDIIHSDRRVDIPKIYKISVRGDEMTFTSPAGVKNRLLYTNAPAHVIPWLGQPALFFECSGRNTLARDCRQFLAGHTRKVLISATSWDADQTLIYGLNHTRHDPSARVISYGSCTVNAYTPLAAFLHKRFGILDSDVNVIHNIQDYKLRDPKNHTLLRKFCTLEKSGRKLLGFLNEDNFTVNYTVVPYSGISMMDFRFRLDRARNLDEILRSLEESFVEGDLRHLYAMDESDRGPEVHRGSTHSAVIIRDSARLMGNNLYLQSYFDNENSVNRFYDLADFLARPKPDAARPAASVRRPGLDFCRVCRGASVALHSVSRRLPVYIWPLPPGEARERQDAKLFVCADCGHLQLQNFPAEFSQRLYAREGFNLESPGEMRIRRDFVDRALGAGCFAGTRVLDVGGGRNSFAAVLEGAEVWVSDYSVLPEVRSRAARAIEGDFLKARLPEKKFDFVCLFHCLEHFNSPADVAAKARTLLKRGGRVLVEVPGIPDVIARAPHYAVFHQHASCFTQKTLDRLFAGAGLFRSLVFRRDLAIFAVYTASRAASRLNPAAPDEPSGWDLADLLRRRLSEIDAALRNLPIDPDPSAVGLYGGGGSAALFLANFPWLEDRIGYCFDRDARKHGRMLLNDRLRIHPCEDLAALSPRQVLFLSSDLCREVGRGMPFEAVDLESILCGSSVDPLSAGV